jgi:opine dehydrogenase
MKKIAVLGGGNGACALAADLASRGYSVNLAELKAFSDHFAPIIEAKGLSYSGAIGEGFAPLNMVTTDIAEAVRDTDILFMSVPSYGQIAFFEQMIPALEDGQTIIVVTGNLASLEFARILRERGITTKIKLAETNTLPYGTRMNGPSSLNVEYKAPIYLSAFPAKDTEEVIASLEGMFEIYPANNVLEMSLLNTNLILHPVECIFNAGRIEYSKGDFYSHGEGFTPVVARFTIRMHDEFQKIAEAYGMEFDLTQMTAEVLGDAVNDAAALPETEYAKLLSAAIQASPMAKIKGPGHLDYRYLTEDVPYGLVPVVTLGDMVDIDAKLTKVLIYLASIINQKDHMAEGRTVEKLGLGGMDPKQIRDFLIEGY